MHATATPNDEPNPSVAWSSSNNSIVIQHEYTNSAGEKVVIRLDKPATYPDGGSQGPHWNAGDPYSPEKISHYYNDK